MIKRAGAVVLLFGMPFMLSILRAEEAVSPDYDAVKKTIEDSIGWALNKDFDRLFSLMANDENLFHFWLTSDSEVVGITAFRKQAREDDVLRAAAGVAGRLEQELGRGERPGHSRSPREAPADSPSIVARSILR